MWFRKISAYATIGFLLIIFPAVLQAQDQKVADSLILYYKNNRLADTARLEILKQIAFHHPGPDIILHYGNELISFAEQDSNLRYLHSGHLQVGHAHKLKGNLEEAAAHFFKSFEAAREAGYQKGIGSASLALGDNYVISNDAKNADHYYNEAISIFRETKDSVNLAIAFLNAGDAALKFKKPDAALDYLMQSRTIFNRLEYSIGVAYSIGNIGLVYAGQGMPAQAEKYLNEAITILEELGDYYPIAVYQASMADIYADKGELDQALQYAQQSLEISRDHGLKEQIRDASLKLSDLYSRTKDYEQAYLHHSRYVAYRDSLNNEETIRKMADLRTEYEVSQKQAEIDLLNKKRELNYIIGLALLFITLLLSVLAVVLYRNNRIRRTANKLLHVQNNKLELQHNKLESLNHTKDRFFSIISHDLRGPVNAFNGISELIKYYIANNEMGQLREVSEYIDKSARQLSSLLDNLLDWSVKQQGTFPFRPEMLYLNPLLLEITDMFRISAHAKNITLNLDVEERISVWADRNSLMTIIRNLLNNALKFTPTDGLVSLSAYTDKGFVHINVIDTGVGIPEEKLESLFLLQDKVIGLGTAGEKGLGIGLSLAQEFAEMNNGSIIANSEVGAGSIFTIKIPLSAAEETKQHYQLNAEEK